MIKSCRRLKLRKWYNHRSNMHWLGVVKGKLGQHFSIWIHTSNYYVSWFLNDKTPDRMCLGHYIGTIQECSGWHLRICLALCVLLLSLIHLIQAFSCFLYIFYSQPIISGPQWSGPEFVTVCLWHICCCIGTVCSPSYAIELDLLLFSILTIVST